MQNEKKELLKKFKTVIDDLMDHYDIEVKFNWNEYFTLLGQCFDATPYHY